MPGCGEYVTISPTLAGLFPIYFIVHPDRKTVARFADDPKDLILPGQLNITVRYGCTLASGVQRHYLRYLWRLSVCTSTQTMYAHANLV